jgi:hypothetical protein
VSAAAARAPEPPRRTLADVDPDEPATLYAEWKAAQLNEIFRQHGVLKVPGRIQPETVTDSLEKYLGEPHEIYLHSGANVMTLQQGQHFLRKGKLLTPRQPDGGFVEAELRDQLAALLPFPTEKGRRHMAQTIIDNETKVGNTPASGTLVFPGRKPYDYEPLRFIRDGHGHVIEQDRAPLSYKLAEARATVSIRSLRN